MTTQVARGAVTAAPHRHGRPVRQPRPPQPEPAGAPAGASRRPGAQRARPGRARRVVQARSHGDPDAAQCGEPSRPVRLGAAASVARADRGRRRRPRRGRRRSRTSRASSSLGVDQALAVAGRAVTDLAHLLAELLENATSFSPPDAAVVVSGALSEHGFVLAIADKGIGLPPERLAACNQLLRHPPVVGLALSRALGLHVVGLLAARHGISVLLRPGSPQGTVAMVMLPNKILEDAPAPEPLVSMPVPETPPDPLPLTARRTGARRPDDEPPVEEWRREGLVTANEALPVNEPVSYPLEADEPVAPRGNRRAAARGGSRRGRGRAAAAHRTTTRSIEPGGTAAVTCARTSPEPPAHRAGRRRGGGRRPAAAVSRARTADATPNGKTAWTGGGPGHRTGMGA